MIGEAILSNGSNLETNSPLEYQIGYSDFTLVAMVRTTRLSGILKYQSIDTDGLYVFIDAFRNIQFRAWTPGGPLGICTTSSPWPNDQDCHSIALVRQSGVLKIYLDGKNQPLTEDGACKANILVQSPTKFTIGTNRPYKDPTFPDYLDHPFNGAVMNVGIWSRALNTTELCQAAFAKIESMAGGMIGYWRLDGDTNDSSTSKNNLTKIGEVRFKPCMDCVWTSGDNNFRFLQMEWQSNIAGMSFDLSQRNLVVSEGSRALVISLNTAHEDGPVKTTLFVRRPDGYIYANPYDSESTFISEIEGRQRAMVFLFPMPGEWTINLLFPMASSLSLQAMVVPDNNVVNSISEALRPLFSNSDYKTSHFATDDPSLDGVVYKAVIAISTAIVVGLTVSTGGLTPAVLAALALFCSTTIYVAGEVAQTLSSNLDEVTVQTAGAAGFLVAKDHLLLIDQAMSVGKEDNDITGPMYEARVDKLYPFLKTSPFAKKSMLLVRQDDTKINVLDALRSSHPSKTFKLISAVGHGSTYGLTGWYESGETGPFQFVLSTEFLKEDLIRGKIFHICGCDTGSSLGPFLVKNGALAFFGYSSKLSMPGPNTRNPAFLSRFCNPDIALVKALLQGQTCGEARDALLNEYQKQIKFFNEAGWATLVSSLERNRNFFVFLGDPNARMEMEVIY